MKQIYLAVIFKKNAKNSKLKMQAKLMDSRNIQTEM